MKTPLAFVIGASLIFIAGCESHNSIEHEHAKSINQISSIEKFEVAAPGEREKRAVTAYRRPAANATRRIIIIPGAPSDVQYWGGAMTMFDPSVDVVAVERPGYHSSGPDRAVTDLSEQAKMISPLIEEFDGEVIIIGHSFGASVALATLELYGDKIDGVVLVSPYVYPVEGKLARWLGFARWSPLRFIGGTSTHRFVREVAAQRRQSGALLKTAEQTCAPALVVHGELDDLVPIANAEKLLHEFPDCAGAEFELIEGGDHYMSVHSAPKLTALVNEFLKRVADRAIIR